jgi:hypothetical protein
MTLEKSLDARKSEINVVYFNRNLCMATAERGGDFLFLRMASRGDVLTSRRKPSSCDARRQGYWASGYP